MSTRKILFCVFAVSILPGCATVATGTTQSIFVDAQREGVQVADAACTLNNDKGNWTVTTPGAVTVTRAFGDMRVQCRKTGHEDGSITVASSTKGAVAGNILIGGLIGVGVDVISGAAYDYPYRFEVEMGRHATIGPRREAKSVGPEPAQLVTEAKREEAPPAK